MKIVVLDGYTLNPGDISWDSLKTLGDVTIYDRSNPEEIKDRVKGADVVLVNKVKIDKEVIDNMDAKYIGLLSTGFDVVDINYAKEKGIIVTNVPTYGTEAVAQMTFAHILNIFNHVEMHNKSVKDGEWQSKTDFTYWNAQLVQLSGKTLGLIGYGNIGQATAKIGKAFGLNIIAYTRSKTSSDSTDKVDFVTLDELFKRSDIVSLHSPLNPGTEKIINKENIDKMKDGVIIINTSRGGLIDEEALSKALNDGKVRAAGLDVVSVEPILRTNPLLKCDNAIITPHIAWAAKEARERLLKTVVENIKNYKKGTPKNVVNGVKTNE